MFSIYNIADCFYLMAKFPFHTLYVSLFFVQMFVSLHVLKIIILNFFWDFISFTVLTLTVELINFGRIRLPWIFIFFVVVVVVFLIFALGFKHPVLLCCLVYFFNYLLLVEISVISKWASVVVELSV